MLLPWGADEEESADIEQPASEVEASPPSNAKVFLIILTRPATSERGAVDILRLRSCRRLPFDEQAIDDWMIPAMGHSLYPKWLFWRPCCSILVSCLTILVSQEDTGTPNRHLLTQVGLNDVSI